MVAIFYYSTDFFLKACIVKEQAQYATIGVGAIMVVMTLVTIPLMDRAGRRTLHLVSSVKRLRIGRICVICLTLCVQVLKCGPENVFFFQTVENFSTVERGPC